MKPFRSIFPALLLALVGWLIASCSQQKQEPSTPEEVELADTFLIDSVESVIEETPMPAMADELFDDFVFNFAGNRKLQMKRIKFPLLLESPSGEQLIDRGKWKMDYLFMPEEYYVLLLDNATQMNVLNDTTLNHVVVERIQLANKQVRNYVFERTGGLWQLSRIKEQPLETCADASFLEFYGKFATDTLFQQQSMADNVTFTAPDPDDELSNLTGTMMPEQWPDFKPEFIPAGTIYNIDYGNTQHSEQQKLFLIRGVANGLETSLTFVRKNGQWRLSQFTY